MFLICTVKWIDDRTLPIEITDDNGFFFISKHVCLIFKERKNGYAPLFFIYKNYIFIKQKAEREEERRKRMSIIVKDWKYFFNPFTYQFNLIELEPKLGQPFSYFTQSLCTNICSSIRRTHLSLKSSDIPVLSSSTEIIIPNERTITIEW